MSPERLLRAASFRFALVYAGLFTVSVAVITAVVFAGMSRALEVQARGTVQAELDELAQRFAAQGSAALVQEIATLVAERRAGPFVYAYLDRDRRLVAGDDLAAVATAPGWVGFDLPGTREEGFEARSFIGRVGKLGDGGLLVVARDADDLDDFRDLMLAGSAWTVTVALVLAIGGGVLMSRFILRRIDAVTATTARIVAGDLDRRVPVAGSGDEFDRLALQLNRMLDRIGELMAGLREVADDIAHDLRTPLGRLRNQLEGMLQGPASVEELRAATAASLAEVDAILDTFGALLRIAQVESGARKAGFRRVDLSRLAGELVDGYRAVAEDRGQTLRQAIAAGVTVRGDPELLTQLLVNLVENALRHTVRGTAVAVALRGSGGLAELVVADDGPGVPAPDRERVLRRFVRLEASRSTPGSGLGLSLVAAIAKLHEATLALEDNEPGLRVVLRLPQDAARPRTTAGGSASVEVAAPGSRTAANAPDPASAFRRTAARLARGAGLALPLLLALAVGAGADEPRPPCGTAPSPAYAEPGSAPAVRVWTGEELGGAWTPPACTGWDRSPLRVLVAAAGRFRYGGDAEGLLARFGAVSTLATVRYWSTSDQRWESLITRAAALDGPDARRRRPDFAVAELAGGADRYFAQDDNRSTGEVVYRMRVREFGPDRVVVEAENASPVRYLLIPLASPGDLRSLYFLERRSATEWGYYSLSRTGTGASRLAGGHQASYANRAVALFRHLAGLPTDQGPPAAP